MEALQQQLEGLSLSEQEVSQSHDIFSKAIRENLSNSEVETMLREEADIEDAEKLEQLVNFWKSSKHSLLEQAIKKTVWNRTIKSLNWRLDVKTDEPEEGATGHRAMAIFEIVLAASQTESEDVFRFTADHAVLSEILGSMQRIPGVVSSLLQEADAGSAEH
eukprot:gnl/Trimastix_PCT/2603.p2 GENE.gnl/Trimastix_PCT/2603~~gnl/Trimastix_PCT/2603.p2  ORF type:complete len:174 (+),score=39.06 gnl/Trimastix_PCT/2603:38-523(+)